MGRFFHKKSSKNCPLGGVAVFECGANALMGGAIVTGIHDEFRGMGLSGVQELLGAGAVVVDVCSMQGAEECKRTVFKT